MLLRTGLILPFLFFSLFLIAQNQNYPKGYFRNPLNIPIQLVANFGELRANHWHMGLDIRTQQRENLPVHAAADGYIAKIKIEPGGFGRAIYINHPNGYTTLYAHLNNFQPALEEYVKTKQYEEESWAVELQIPSNLFPVKKGDFIAYSGNTGGSQGPHVHFEIRDTKTDDCLNPLMFGMEVPDAVPPTISRLAMYDRTKSVYQQTPQLMALQKVGNVYRPTKGSLIKVGVNRLSFAIGATDRFTNYTNPNGIYSAHLYVDDELISGFNLDKIDYNETRYLNAQIDYRYKAAGGPYLQHLSKMPGDTSDVYTSTTDNALVHLEDSVPHKVRIVVKDAVLNTSTLEFNIQYSESLSKASLPSANTKLLPQQVNVFETDNFELFTSEFSAYDTIPIVYSLANSTVAGAVSPVFTFLNANIPTHDSITVRIKPSEHIDAPNRDKVVIKNTSGKKIVVEKAKWQGEWITAKFRQFGTFQAFIDNMPPAVSAPPTNLKTASRLVFTPTDNFNTIKSFRAEVDGQWLRFTNDKGRTHVYRFDEKFPAGEHQLKLIVEDEAGNKTERVWNVVR